MKDSNVTKITLDSYAKKKLKDFVESADEFEVINEKFTNFLKNQADIAQNPKFDFTFTYSEGDTILHLAAQTGNLELTKLILEKSHAPEKLIPLTAYNGATAFDRTAENALDNSPQPKEKYFQILQVIANYATPEDKVNMIEKYRKNPQITNIINNASPSLNNSENKMLELLGGNELHILARMSENNSDNEEKVKNLIKKNMDINALDNDGNTPIYLAAENGNNNLFKILLNNGANPNIKGKYGTAMEMLKKHTIGEKLDKNSEINILNDEIEISSIELKETRQKPNLNNNLNKGDVPNLSDSKSEKNIITQILGYIFEKISEFFSKIANFLSNNDQTHDYDLGKNDKRKAMFNDSDEMKQENNMSKSSFNDKGENLQNNQPIPANVKDQAKIEGEKLKEQANNNIPLNTPVPNIMSKSKENMGSKIG